VIGPGERDVIPRGRPHFFANISEGPAAFTVELIPAQQHLQFIETVLAPGDAPHLGKILDMIMLTLVYGSAGADRTRVSSGLDKAGFRLTRVVPTELG